MSSVSDYFKQPVSEESFSDLKQISKMLTKYQQHDHKLLKATEGEGFDKAVGDPRSDSKNYTEMSSLKDRNGHSINDLLSRKGNKELCDKLDIIPGSAIQNIKFKRGKKAKPYNVYVQSESVNMDAPIALRHSEFQRKVQERLVHERHFQHQPRKVLLQHRRIRKRAQHKAMLAKQRDVDKKPYLEANQFKTYLTNNPRFNASKYIDNHPNMARNMHLINGSRINYAAKMLTGSSPHANNDAIYNVKPMSNSFHLMSKNAVIKRTNQYVRNHDKEFAHSRNVVQQKDKIIQKATNATKKFKHQLQKPMNSKDYQILKQAHLALDDSVSKAGSNARHSYDFSNVKLGNSNLSNVIAHTPTRFQERIGAKSGKVWQKQLSQIDRKNHIDPKSDPTVTTIRTNYLYNSKHQRLSLAHVAKNVDHRLIHERSYRMNHKLQIRHEDSKQLKANLQKAIMMKTGLQKGQNANYGQFLDQNPKFAKDIHMESDRQYYKDGIDLKGTHKVFDTNPRSKNLGYKVMSKDDMLKRTNSYIRNSIPALSQSIFENKVSQRSRMNDLRKNSSIPIPPKNSSIPIPPKTRSNTHFHHIVHHSPHKSKTLSVTRKMSAYLNRRNGFIR